MLRITSMPGHDRVPLLKLEGKLIGPWLEELTRAVQAETASAEPPDLDLSALLFADQDGERLLRQLIKRGCHVAACSGYIAELLQGEPEDR